MVISFIQQPQECTKIAEEDNKHYKGLLNIKIQTT